MARSLSWTELNGGLLALVSIAAIAIAVLLFARVGALHGGTFRVFALTDDARGVIRGTEVWLDGQKVGLVKNVGFRGIETPEKNRLVLSLEILDGARAEIRTDSHADIRSGSSIIAAPVVYITSGTPRGRPLHDGDTLYATAQTDYESTASQLAEAGQQLPAIISNVRLLSLQMRSARSTLGAFGLQGGGAALRSTEANASRLVSRLTAAHGTLGGIMSGSGPLTTRARHALAETDSIRALLASGQTTFGRFRRDSSLVGAITDVRQELAHVLSGMPTSGGTLGRARQDSAIQNALAAAYEQMDLLLADVKRHPLRYLVF